MKLLALALALAVAPGVVAGCSKKAKEAAPAPEPAKPAPAAAPVDADAGSADPSARAPSQYKMEKPARTETTGFARFDDAVAGKAPWLTDAESAAGVVEHTDIAKKVSLKRLCKADANAALDKYGAVLVKRIKDPAYESPACVASNTEGTETSCIAGRGPNAEPSVLLDYRKSGEGWTLAAIQYVDGDSDFRPHRDKYEKLITTPCK